MKRWYLGSMNDGLFIIDAPPRSVPTDVAPHVSETGPQIVLNVTELSEDKARAIIDAHNANICNQKGN